MGKIEWRNMKVSLTAEHLQLVENNFYAGLIYLTFET